jgi:hypothetical protein
MLMAILDAPDYSLDHATWGLVIVTGLLVIGTIATVVDGVIKGRRQDRRWEDEDKQRKEDAQPKALVELATYADDRLKLLFAVFNLGNNTFLIDKLIVASTTGRRYESQMSPQIVTPGTWVTIEFEPRHMLSERGESTAFVEAYGILVLKGATDTVTTKPEWFYVSYGSPNYRFPWEMGRLSERVEGAMVKVPRLLPSPESPNPTSVVSSIGHPVDKAVI